MSDFHMLASGVLVLGYEMEMVILSSGTSVLYLYDIPKIFFILAFCLYTLTVILAGVMHLKDTIHMVLPIVTAAVAILAGIFIIVGMGVHAGKLGKPPAFASAVHGFSLILAIVGGVLMLLGTFVFTSSSTSRSTSSTTTMRTTTTHTSTTQQQQYY